MSVNHYENFPVASLLCPKALRPVVTALYRYARTADDIADEGDADAASRLADLAAYREDLLAVCAGRPPGPRWPEVFRSLARQIHRHSLPRELLLDLLDAFEQDVRNPVYVDRAQLLDYCRRSASPIGRLLLHLYGVRDGRSLAQSDAICTALQLINFWQDLSVDGPRRRHYVTQADQSEYGVTLHDLKHLIDSRRSRALVQDLCGWSRTLMLQGAPLATRLPGRSGWELRLVVQGGLRILEKIQQMDHAALLHRPRISALDVPLLLWRALKMSGARA